MFAFRVRRNAIAYGVAWGTVALVTLTVLGTLPSAPAGAPGPGSAGVVPAVAPGVPVPPQVLANVAVGAGPVASVYDPANGFVYVVNSAANTVSVLGNTTVVATLNVTVDPRTGTTVAGDPAAAVYDAADGSVYVVDRFSFELGGGWVAVLHGTSVSALLPVGLLPTAAAFDPADGLVYVTNSESANVSLLRGPSVVGSVDVGATPGAAAFDPVDGNVYVALGGGTVALLNGSSVVGSLPVGIGPDALAYDPVDQEMYVANNGSSSVTVLSPTAVVGTGPVGANPVALAVDPANGWVYVSDAGSSDVTVLAGTTAVGRVPTGAGPGGSVYDAATDVVYVTEAGNATVIAVQNLSVLGAVGVGTTPSSATFDPANGLVYVPNADSHNVSVLATAFAVHFRESGLAPGTVWNVTLGASPQSASAAAIDFGRLPGTYPYSVGTPAGYRLLGASPASPVEVLLGPVNVSVAFGTAGGNATYTLAFEETGLRGYCGRSTLWSVTVGNETKSASGSTIAFAEPNGTYNYSVRGPADERVLSSVPASPVPIAGANVTVAVTFGPGASAEGYTVTFVETGLPRGTAWCVTLGATACARGEAVRFSDLSSGSYGFSVGPVGGFTADPAAGTVVVYHQSVTVYVHFSAPHHHHRGSGCGGGHDGSGDGGRSGGGGRGDGGDGW